MITTLIPVFLRTTEDFNNLIAAVDSVLTQTLLPDEILVTDDTIEEDLSLVVQDYLKGLRITNRYLKNVGPSNASRNTNFGVNEVKSEYVHILHQDDRIVRNDFYFDVEKRNKKDKKIWYLAPGGTKDKKNTMRFSPNLVFGFNTIGGPSALVIDVSKWIALDEDFIMLPDVVHFYSLLLKYGPPQILDEFTIQYGSGPHQASQRISPEQIKRDVNLLYSKGVVKAFNMLSFLEFRIWGNHLLLICKVTMFNSKVSKWSRAQALTLFVLVVGYLLVARIKNWIVTKSSNVSFRRIAP